VCLFCGSVLLGCTRIGSYRGCFVFNEGTLAWRDQAIYESQREDLGEYFGDCMNQAYRSEVTNVLCSVLLWDENDVCFVEKVGHDTGLGTCLDCWDKYLPQCKLLLFPITDKYVSMWGLIVGCLALAV
jgi:hypothetical protein